MRNALLTLFTALILCSLNPAGLSAQTPDGSMSIQTAAESLGLNLYYHANLKQLSLVKQNRMLNLHPGEDIAVLNGSIPVQVPGIESAAGNRITVSAEGFAALRSLLAPEQEDGIGRRIGAIFIDAGHGGRDPGAIGRHVVEGSSQVLQEKDVVLSVAKSVAQALAQHYPDRNLVLSRDKDVYLTLEERTSMANAVTLKEGEAILYVSIHANASINSQANGFEVWYLPPDYRRQLISPGDVETISDSVIPILNDILEEEISTESILLAQSISKNLEQVLEGQSVNRGLFEEEWYVVRNARMPSVLVEIGFVTNPDEFRLLSNPEYLQKVSAGIYNGVLSYISNFESIR